MKAGLSQDENGEFLDASKVETKSVFNLNSFRLIDSLVKNKKGLCTYKYAAKKDMLSKRFSP